ncbi:hypothetical protein SDJN02_22280, partial [Cucurbita argyrosperma subsp. argyrosperma]
MEGVHRRPSKGGGRSLEVIDVRKLSENQVHLSQSRRPAAMDPSAVKPRVVKTGEGSRGGSGNSWWKNPEMKRQRRVAKYKLYTVEGRVKDSIKKGMRWFKSRCSRIVYGF